MTKRIFWAAPFLALGLTAPPALASDEPQHAAAHEAEQASIAFVSQGGIRNWRAEDRDTLYVQDRRRQWYKATLMMPAFDLPFAWAIGFDTGPINRLDKFSTLVVEGRRYPLNSLVKVDGPPARNS